MNDDQFTKLFRYIEDFRGDVTGTLESKADKQDVERILTSVDSLAESHVNATIEQSARDAQWNRLIEWAREVSKKTGIPLPDL